MYGCPPEGAPARTLSPANPTDLLYLRGHARREIAAIKTQIDAALQRRDVTLRPLRNRLATWERIEAMASALLDSAQLIVRHELPVTWRQRLTGSTFWLGVLAGLAITAAVRALA